MTEINKTMGLITSKPTTPWESFTEDIGTLYNRRKKKKKNS